MHLAVLMTNTDESAFAQNHPKDGQKFSDLVHLARPGWTVEVFAVKDGIFPADLSHFDGAIITGSPASVRSDAAWVQDLFALIRDMHARQMPLFGACFGHQAIAVALGGEVGSNPDGWVHGLTDNQILERRSWMHSLSDETRLYASHCEQVTILPHGAQVLVRSRQCEVAGFAIGDHIYTTQHHPEMSRAFISALTDEMNDELGPELAARARGSLSRPADQTPFAESVACFFEQAQRR